jgi:hypothetical protein
MLSNLPFTNLTNLYYLKSKEANNLENQRHTINIPTNQ